jgi:hypothetical protein
MSSVPPPLLAKAASSAARASGLLNVRLNLKTAVQPAGK